MSIVRVRIKKVRKFELDCNMEHHKSFLHRVKYYILTAKIFEGKNVIFIIRYRAQRLVEKEKIYKILIFAISMELTEFSFNCLWPSCHKYIVMERLAGAVTTYEHIHHV